MKKITKQTLVVVMAGLIATSLHATEPQKADAKTKLINTVSASTGGLIVGSANSVICAVKSAGKGARKGASSGHKSLPVIGTIVVATVEGVKGFAQGALKGAKEGVEEGTRKTSEALSNK